MSTAKPIIETMTHSYELVNEERSDIVTVAGWTFDDYMTLRDALNASDPFFNATVNEFYISEEDYQSRTNAHFNIEFRDSTRPVRELWAYFNKSNRLSVFMSDGESVVRFRVADECSIWEHYTDEELENEFNYIHSNCRNYPKGRAPNNSFLSGWEIVKDRNLGIDLSHLIR